MHEFSDVRISSEFNRFFEVNYVFFVTFSFLDFDHEDIQETRRVRNCLE